MRSSQYCELELELLKVRSETNSFLYGINV